MSYRRQGPAFIPCDTRAITNQIGRRVLMSICGLRVIRRETGVTLPVASGYTVTVDLAADDTYTVRRIYGRGSRQWVHGERTEVYAEQLSEAAYFASSYKSYSASEWPKRHL